jgi:hypothetical protein
MISKTLTMLATGDLLLYHPEPESLFILVAPTLKSADVVGWTRRSPLHRK